jgi:pyruvate dehydrogenase E2 component (dihydrolipoamide acetyltransferase)
MAIDVRMPKLSDTMESGVIIRWMKAPGDVVAKGDPIAEVETDKADVELEASDSGVLREITVPEGQSAAVGAVIAVLAAAGEAGGDGGAPLAPALGEERGAAPARERTGQPARPAESAPRPPALPRPSRPPQPQAAPPAPPRPSAQPTPVRASPLAWRIADSAGIDLGSLRGSGPGGRILKRDVEMAMRAATPPAPPQAGEAGGEGEGTVPAAPQPAGSRREEVSRMRATIARRMSEAKRDIPHFYVTAEIDMTEAMHLRESIRRRDSMPGLTVTHLLVRALAIALQRHPHVNASWQDGAIIVHDDINIGIAVAVDDGLVVPVLHRVQTLNLGDIAAAASELTEKARNGRFGGEDLTGATFSLSNVGMLDVEELTAVINPPNAAILATGAVKERPIVRDGQLAIAKTLRATLSCDHRVLNGLEGGRFLVELKSILENPVSLLLE